MSRGSARVRVHDSTPHEPIFLSVNDLGKFRAPAADRCAVTKRASSGLVEGGGGNVEEDPGDRFSDPGIRDEAVARFLVIQPVKQPSVAGCMHWLRGGPRTWTLYRLARISKSMSISPALVRRVGRA